MMAFGLNGSSVVYMFIFWLVIIIGALWLLSRLFPSGDEDVSHQSSSRHGDRGESPLDILRQRYARGEITREEFDQMRRDLRG
jgi:putative membrane protein